MSWFFVFGVPLVLTLVLTPIIKLIAIKINAVDHPDERKVHTKVMPRLGGLAIFLSSSIGMLIFSDITKGPLLWIMLGSLVIITLGIIDDLKPLSAKIKLVFQVVAASILIYGGIDIEFINVPMSDKVIYLGNWSYLITILWIVGITNALNLIDGLDGLAAGVSSISLATILIMSLSMGNNLVTTIALAVLGSTLGFLVFNFYPAKIFLGDSGSLYLGFILATLSILGFKNVAVVSFIFPIIILAVPIFDTIFAIIRRFRIKAPITVADKMHLHHCLIGMGFSHRKTVFIIYGISIIFGLAAIFLSQASFWMGLITIVTLMFITLIGIEWTGVIGGTKKPVTHLCILIGDRIVRFANNPYFKG